MLQMKRLQRTLLQNGLVAVPMEILYMNIIIIIVTVIILGNVMVHKDIML